MLQIPTVPHRPLPAPPTIRVVVERDRTPEARATGGFLNLRRVELVANYPDGTKSEPFSYDLVTRAALDAVVIAAWYTQGTVRYVFLRSAVRPPVALRPVPPSDDGSLWELPAGLIEPGEDPAQAAARELEEELGFVAEAAAMRPLGEWTFPAPGIIGERHVFLHLEVEPRARGVPSEDGSALERAANVVAVPVEEAIDQVRRGLLRDAKTELGLRRLAEVRP